MNIPPDLLTNPRKFCKWLWPHSVLYDKQWEVFDSVLRDDETVVPAGNMLGKDYIAAEIIIFFFCTRRPCRIITSSAKDDHLIVLWSEMKNFIRTSTVPLTIDLGGPLHIKHREILWEVDGKKCEKSYIKGMVASDESLASLGGHHVPNVGDGIPRTLWVCDEASSVNDDYKKVVDPWAVRELIIGNTYPCNNFFYKAVKGDRKNKIPGGDIPREDRRGFHRKVIQIKATDSPNVRYALEEKKLGLEPSDRIIVPGVKSWGEYCKNRVKWDAIKQSVSLDAEFYEGAAIKMFPASWLDRAEIVAEILKEKGVKRTARAIGVDPAEGGDWTAIAVVDELGLLDLVYAKTPNTAVIKHEVVKKMKQWGVGSGKVIFDRGGGGKQIADQMREMGYDHIRSISFGESASAEIKYGKTMPDERIDVKETRTAYKNLRAQMYARLMNLLDPTDLALPQDGIEKGRTQTWGIPKQFSPELREELEPVPKLYNEEGVLYFLRKYKRNKDDTQETLTDLIGHSPDLSDAVVLALHAMETEDDFEITAM